MAIKIECAQCGFQNDLGRVFCTQCGQKLDMHRTSMTDMKDRRTFEFGRIVRRLVGWVVMLAMAACLGLAFWAPARVGLLMDQAGIQQVPFKMGNARKAISARQKCSVVLAEGEINGYLAERAQSRKLVALTMDFKPGEFDLEARLKWVPAFTNLAWLADVKIPISCGLTGTFDEGALVVKRVYLGHLPLIGPATAPVRSFFARIFNDVIAEKTLVNSLTGVTFSDVKADVSFGK